MDMKNQIEEGAKVIGLSVEEATSKLEEICSENGIETSNPIALGLWRNEHKSLVMKQNQMMLSIRVHSVSLFLLMRQEI